MAGIDRIRLPTPIVNYKEIPFKTEMARGVEEITKVKGVAIGRRKPARAAAPAGPPNDDQHPARPAGLRPSCNRN
jgi:hypothetical protein